MAIPMPALSFANPSSAGGAPVSSAPSSAGGGVWNVATGSAKAVNSGSASQATGAALPATVAGINTSTILAVGIGLVFLVLIAKAIRK